MRVSATVQTRTRGGVPNRAKRPIRQVLALVAGDLIRVNVEAIAAGTAPDGGPQQQNTPAVAAEKQRRLGHSRPLQDQGILGDPAGYRVRQVASGVSVSLPAGRAQRVVEGLRARGYRVFEYPEALRERHSALMSAALTHAADKAVDAKVRG